MSSTDAASPTIQCFSLIRRRSREATASRPWVVSNFETIRINSGTSFPPINRICEPVGREDERRGSLNFAVCRQSRSVERVSKNKIYCTKRVSEPIYTLKNIKRCDFLTMVKEDKESKKYNQVKNFYFETFLSYANICATFKKPKSSGPKTSETSELNLELIYTVYDELKDLPSSVQRQYLKGVVNCLLDDDGSLVSRKDRLRGLFVLIQSPIFLSQSSYNVLARLIRTITELPNFDHQILVAWFMTIEKRRFRMVVNFITQFLTVRQFPPMDKSLPPPSSCKWWIPAAIKLLAILYASNLAAQPSLVHYTEFYNHILDHLDLLLEYKKWQRPDQGSGFSYCQYPFVLSMVAKRFILTKDAEEQMILIARRSLVSRLSEKRAPNLDIFFLNIHVRRNNILEDSLNELGRRKDSLKKKLRVSFDGEPGLDMGGLTKEWFMLLTKEIFNASSKMFVYHESVQLFWFATNYDGPTSNYNLIGVLMGLAVYNSIILDIKFPTVCYRKLLEPPVLPSDNYKDLGIIKDHKIEDLVQIMPQISKSLNEILNYEGDVENDLGLSFQITHEEFGEMHTVDLVENGSNISLTNENREEFVLLYVDWCLNSAIYEQFKAFYTGFHSVTASNALIMLRPEEIEVLVCGSPNFDLEQLRKITDYDGYTSEHPVIKWFWQVILEMSLTQQKQFLLFCTGSDRVPVGGMSEMKFKVSCWQGQTNMLPLAHTCFNQLVLPPYKDKNTLKFKLTIAMQNSEGFGLQ